MKERIIKILLKYLLDDCIPSDLFEWTLPDVGMDELDITEFVMDIEAEFKIVMNIPDEYYDYLKISDICDIIAGKLE